MKATSILNIKSWLSKLHPPLPRSARESEQLLSVLTSSFQRQLDEAHPPIERRGRSLSHPSDPAARNTTQTKLRQIESLIHSSSLGTHFATAGDVHGLSSTVVGNSAGYGHTINDGAGSLEALLRFLNARSIETKAGQSSKTNASEDEKVVTNWFQHASTSNKTLVFMSRPILKTLKEILPRAKLTEILWSEIEKFVIESSETVTYEEAEAISTSCSFIITSTPRSAMRHSADGFSRVIALFRERGYNVRMSDDSPNSISMATFHPLTDPASKLAQFIIAHPDTNELESRHFDVLLSISNLWENSSILRVPLVKAFHPTRPYLSGISKALRNPATRVTYSSRLKEMQSSQRRFPPIAPLMSVGEKLRKLGRYEDAAVIQGFLKAHNAGEDVSNISRYIAQARNDSNRSLNFLGQHQPAWT